MFEIYISPKIFLMNCVCLKFIFNQRYFYGLCRFEFIFHLRYIYELFVFEIHI